MNIIPMPAEYEPQVRGLYREYHPTWPELPALHFFVYPTLIAIEDERVAGYTSFSMNVSDHGDLSIIFQDIGTAEWARGRGVAKALHQRRVEVGLSVGAQAAVGVTQPDNAPMLSILRGDGFEEIMTIPKAYVDGRDGVLFIRYLRDNPGWRQYPTPYVS